VASTVNLTGRNLPPPQSPFVDKANLNLSYDGYQFLLNLLNAATSALTQQSVGPALVASGATRATALQLTDQWNVITSGSGGVLLAVNQPGQIQTVFNKSGSGINVYPPPGYKIDASAANVAYSLANPKIQIFYFISSTQIYSLQLG
jgi:hypothetical protein